MTPFSAKPIEPAAASTVKSQLMKLIQLAGLLALLVPFTARAGGDEVVVIYNSRVPESKAVAEHYAAARAVPASQIFGFALTTNEVMTRDDFTDFLQKPLADRLAAAGLWKFGEASIAMAGNQPAHLERRVVESKIRYAVLCWGMPLKIAASSRIEEVVEKITRTEFQRNEAAVDSELAWLPLLKMNIPLTGPLPNRLYGTTNHAMLSPLNGILLVSRLDGPTPAIANQLVDKALTAESNGFWGRAYFDARGLKTNDSYYLGDQWMLTGAEICREHGFEIETDTNAETWPAARPMSHIAIYAGWYAGDADGPFAEPNVEFMPGAFAYHLHSFSADSLRSATKNWCGPLLAKGATCTMGCVYEPYLQFTPNIALFLESFCNGYTFGEAAWNSANALSWQTTVIGDPLYQPFKKALPELHAELTRAKNPLIEWSFDRLVNLDLARGIRAPPLAQFLENVPATAQSAVLTEKLAGLYAAAGKPSSAIESYQAALKLNPSPQQRVRIRLVLGKKLELAGRSAEAMENYQKLLAEVPDYPGRDSIAKLMAALQKEVASTNPPTK
jgi:uncharacterized protein (TIGR03790 family)